jgi:hypothetical protein
MDVSFVAPDVCEFDRIDVGAVSRSSVRTEFIVLGTWLHGSSGLPKYSRASCAL